MADLCRVCERPDCDKVGAYHAYADAYDDAVARRVDPNIDEAAVAALLRWSASLRECSGNRVDWRARALRAEAALGDAGSVRHADHCDLVHYNECSCGATRA